MFFLARIVADMSQRELRSDWGSKEGPTEGKLQYDAIVFISFSELSRIPPDFVVNGVPQRVKAAHALICR